MNDDATKPPLRGMIIKTDNEKAMEAMADVFQKVQEAARKLGLGVLLISVDPVTRDIHLESTMPPEICQQVLQKSFRKLRKGNNQRIVRAGVIPSPTGRKN